MNDEKSLPSAMETALESLMKVNALIDLLSADEKIKFNERLKWHAQYLANQMREQYGLSVPPHP